MRCSCIFATAAPHSSSLHPRWCTTGGNVPSIAVAGRAISESTARDGGIPASSAAITSSAVGAKHTILSWLVWRPSGQSTRPIRSQMYAQISCSAYGVNGCTRSPLLCGTHAEDILVKSLCQVK